MELIRFDAAYDRAVPCYVDARTIAALVLSRPATPELWAATRIVTYHGVYYEVAGTPDDVARTIKDAEMMGYPIREAEYDS